MKNKFILLCFLLISLSGCVKDYFQGDRVGYSEKFSNRTEYTIDLPDISEGLYSIYYGCPYSSGSLCKDPILTGYGPIQTTLSVPNDVSKIWVLNSMRSYTLESPFTKITSDPGNTRSISNGIIPQDIIDVISGLYFPEKKYNIRSENLLKCTDLVIEKENTDLKITYITDGGFGDSYMYGYLWFYTYPSEKYNSLKLSDCKIYGRNGKNIIQVSESDLYGSKKSIFSSKTEENNGNPKYTTIDLGNFDAGQSIGFIFLEPGSGSLRFTTPSLNKKIIDFTIKYPDTNSYFDLSGRYTNSGVIINHTSQESDKNYNILGMEYKLPDVWGYDGDYNDMVCVITSSELVFPKESILNQDPPNEIKIQEGIYLFEDNYPNRGDFDFNDVIIQYYIKDFYKDPSKKKLIKIDLLARGSIYNNSFGYIISGDYISFLGDIHGYDNVKDLEYKNLNISIEKEIYGDLGGPWLNNGKNYIFGDNYNTGLYPYVLEIPISNPSWRFRWSKEGISIDDSYYFLKSITSEQRDPDWYLTPKDNTKVFEW